MTRGDVTSQFISDALSLINGPVMPCFMPRKGRYKHVDYTSVSIPKEMVMRIDQVISDGKLAYISTGEFVRDAIRRLLEELEDRYKKKAKP